MIVYIPYQVSFILNFLLLASFSGVWLYFKQLYFWLSNSLHSPTQFKKINWHVKKSTPYTYSEVNGNFLFLISGKVCWKLFITKVNVFYIFHVLPQHQYKRMVKTKVRGYYKMLHSQDNLSVTCWNDNNIVLKHHIFFYL